MTRFDVGIFGWGMLPLLLSHQLLRTRPDQRVLLLAADPVAGGDTMEPVRCAALSDTARGLVEPYSVMQWPGYFIARDGAIERHDEAVWLLDPMQAWLDLQDQSARCAIVTDCPAPAAAQTRFGIGSQVADIDRLIDLAPLTGLRCATEIIGMEAVRQLDLPILADYDTALPGWEANQLLPLGDERVMVRKLPNRTGLVAANSTFESLLNALVAD